MSALLGIAIGLFPCPSALAAYFTSMSTGTPVNGYVVIGLFAAGIASSLMLVGIFVQIFGNRLFQSGFKISKTWMRVQAAVITGIGIFYLTRVAIA